MVSVYSVRPTEDVFLGLFRHPDALHAIREDGRGLGYILQDDQVSGGFSQDEAEHYLRTRAGVGCGARVYSNQ